MISPPFPRRFSRSWRTSWPYAHGWMRANSVSAVLCLAHLHYLITFALVIRCLWPSIATIYSAVYQRWNSRWTSTARAQSQHFKASLSEFEHGEKIRYNRNRIVTEHFINNQNKHPSWRGKGVGGGTKSYLEHAHKGHWNARTRAAMFGRFLSMYFLDLQIQS